MKRMLKYLIIITAVAALGICMAGALGLFGTSAGAKLLLDTVSRHTDVKISAEKIEGKLAGTLRLKNMDMTWPQGRIQIKKLELSMQPLDLLVGHVNIRNLAAEKISFDDHAPDKQPKLIWPRASGWIASFSGKIGRLEMSHLTYRRPDEQPLEFQEIVASVAWRNAQLSVGNLRLVSDLGVFNGSLLAGFKRPLLQMDLAAILPQPTAGIESLRLDGKFGPGQGSGELSGNLHLAGLQNHQPVWQMSADTGMTSKGFPLKNIRVRRTGRPGSMTGDGALTFSGTELFLTLRAQAVDIDLSSELKIPTKLSGSLTFAGTGRQYQGRITLANEGETWQSLRMAGDYSGNAESVTLSQLKGAALGGALSGNLTLAWQNGLSISGALSGRNLDPAKFDPDWEGAIHFDLSGRVSAPEQKPITGEITCSLLQSRLHGRQLTGDLRATFDGDDIRIANLALQGKGFQITARGDVKTAVDFTARISDVSRLVVQTAGSVAASGWVRRRNDRFSGVLSASAHGLTADGLEITSAGLNAAWKDQEKSPLSLNATCTKLRYQNFTADTLTLLAQGTVDQSTLAASLRKGPYEAHLAVSGAWLKDRWQGKVVRLDGTDSVGPWRLDQPAALAVTAESLSLEPIKVTGRGSETLRFSGKLSRTPLIGALALDWNELNPARANIWMDQELLSGTSSGHLQLSLLPRDFIELAGKIILSGTLRTQGQTVNIRQSEMTLKADERGTRVGLNAVLAQGGSIQGNFTSSLPAKRSMPDGGDLTLRWQEFDLAPFSTWLPGQTRLEGQMAGEISGKLLPNRRFSLAGRTALTQSKIHWQGQKGNVSIDLRQASLSWVWREDALQGDITMILGDLGKLQGKIRLPIAARFPVAMNTRGNLQGSFTGRVQEKGALGILFPGAVQESRGDLDMDVRMSGSPANPLFEGSIRLSKAGAYLPTAGIAVKDAQIAARFTRDTITIDSFRAASGPGYIDGNAVIRLKGLQIVSFEGRLSGERFQTIYFPELQVQSSPRLTFTGTTEKISVRGEVLLPLMRVIGSPSQGPVKSSSDVIREGKTKPAAKKPPIRLDVQVKMTLGDEVQFNGSGIDAKLGGRIDLSFQDPERIAGRGEIRVVKGRFRTYGVNLEIVRGRLFYAGQPINQPTLDILALRKVGDVQAGVTVGGTLQKPLIKLYSDPFMQDMDILAYIVLGHPLGSDSKQANLLASAASAILTSQQTENLLRQIQNRLGLASLEISTDVLEKSNRMGYKRINVTPAGTSVAISPESVSETMLAVGKYLTPELYISYGRSLFSGGNLFFLRYDLSKHWQIETQTGQESGIDIYYKLEFN